MQGNQSVTENKPSLAFNNFFNKFIKDRRPLVKENI